MLPTGALYQKLYIQSKSAPEDGRMSPETCKAEVKRLMNEKVVAYCWLFSSLCNIHVEDVHTRLLNTRLAVPCVLKYPVKKANS